MTDPLLPIPDTAKTPQGIAFYENLKGKVSDAEMTSIVEHRQFIEIANVCDLIKTDIDSGQNEGGVIVFTGPMRGGKTLGSLSLSRALDSVSQKFVKPYDPRDPERVRSSTGMVNQTELLVYGNSEAPHDNLESIRDLLVREYDPRVLYFDEPHFSPNDVPTMIAFAEERRRKGLWTIVSSLDFDFARRRMTYGTDFDVESELEFFAAHLNPQLVVTFSADCETCKQPAKYSQRLIDHGDGWVPASVYDPIILAEGKKEHYEPRCECCHKNREEIEI